jgi:hypothetical protein
MLLGRATPEPGAAGLALDGIATQAVVIASGQYFLWNRLAVRFVEGATLVSLGRNGHNLGVAAAAACAVADVALAAVLLTARARMPLRLRLALDSVDVASWSLAVGHPVDVATLAAAPLAAEAATRGWAGLAVPAAVGTTTSAALLVAGRPLEPMPFVWPLVAMACGRLLGAYVHRRLARQVATTVAGIEAAAGQAELAGQHSVAVGADTVVDLLTRTAPLIAVLGDRPPSSPLAAWKQALAEAGSGQATYLRLALARWERLRNSLDPELSADVELHCPDGEGTLLLSPAQASHLERELERLGPRGTVTVRALTAAPAGRRQVLVVGASRVVLPADPGPSAPRLDPGPMTFLLGAVGFLGQSLPWSDGVPVAVTGPLVAAAVALGWWSHGRTGRHGDRAHPGVLAAALALGGADAVLATLTMRNLETDHLVRLPFMLFVMWSGPLAVFYWRDLTSAQRRVALAAPTVIVAAGFLLLPVSVPVAQFLAAAVWPAMAILASLGLRAVIERDTAAVGVELARRHELAVEEAYGRGRQLVVDLASAAADETRAAYLKVSGRLPQPIAAEVDRRLAEVSRRLGALSAQEPGSAPIAS